MKMTSLLKLKEMRKRILRMSLPLKLKIRLLKMKSSLLKVRIRHLL